MTTISRFANRNRQLQERFSFIFIGWIRGAEALYSGKRGKRKMKYLFYIYYPAHLVVIYWINLLL